MVGIHDDLMAKSGPSMAIWLKSRPETEPVKSWQVTHSYHWPSQPLFLMVQDKAQVGIQGDPNIL